MKYTMIGLVAAGVWYSASASHAPARASADAPKQQQQDHWNWSGRLAAGKTISIDGINGDISAEPATGNEVIVTAEKHGRRSDPSDVRIVVAEYDGGVRICAIYPSSREGRCDADGSHNNNIRNNDVQVDFTVKVPRGVHFEGQTVNGDVEATNLDGNVDITTVNGGAQLETSGGEAHAETVNGSVNATVRAIGSHNMKFQTVNGGITVTLPAGLSADLDAETVNGSITSDFPVSVQGRLSPRHLQGRIGQGGRQLDMETVNGSIRIRQVP